MHSFEVQTNRPQAILDTLLKEAGTKRSMGIVILTGDLTRHSASMAQHFARQAPLAQWLIVCAAGALSERGELDRSTGAVGMRLPRGSEIVLAEKPNVSFGEQLSARLLSRPGATGCVFLAAPFGEDEWLTTVHERLRGQARHLFGGGTLPSLPLLFTDDGRVRGGRAAGVILGGGTLGQLCSSSACRLLSPIGQVTKSIGPIIHEIDGVPALERLSQSTEGLEEHTLVLLALAASEKPLTGARRALALRPIQGVDPARGTLLLGDDIAEGSPVAFAVRDAHGARSDFEAQLRALRRSGNGTAPGFGIYISCAGRGRALYKVGDVDTKLIANQFPKMPFVGMHSTFEIAPLRERYTPQVYAGVLGLFSLPS